MTSFEEQYGPWAVVTGAGAGVGRSFAEAILARGVGVVLVDLADGIDAVAAEMPGETRSLQADVSDPAWLDGLSELTADIDIGLAVANAGASYVGRYRDMDAATRRLLIEVNCIATADLTSWALPAMVDRGRGGIVATSSGSALVGTAGVALYSGTKAFSVNLMEALGWELRGTGVDTLAVVAPAMDSDGFRASGADPDGMMSPPVDPRTVVEGALDALPDGGRWLGDPGIEIVAGIDRSERLDIMSQATTGMYPDKFANLPD